MKYVVLDTAPELTELALGGGTTDITFEALTALTTFTWRPDFKLASVAGARNGVDSGHV